jgi:uracil-DNA glycosylase family 4
METLDALRSYVRFLREREGVREVALSPAALRGLAVLGGPARGTGAASPSVPSAVGSRRPPGDGVAVPATATARLAPVGLRSPSDPADGRAPSPGGRRLPAEGASRPVPSITVPSAPRIEETITVSGSTKAEQLAHLGERAAVCVKCPHLAARRHHVVFGVGNSEARILFVGEAPGEDEDLQGEPFVGRAGQLLTKMIAAMGLTRGDVYIANILKCRPDMPAGSPGNRKPTKDEMDTCLPYLRAQIDVIKPEVMIALGATALEGLLGPVGGISKLRGKFLEYRDIPLMPTFHPSYLLRNASNTEKRKVWEDLLQVMERTGMPINEKQRGYFLSK